MHTLFRNILKERTGNRDDFELAVKHVLFNMKVTPPPRKIALNIRESEELCNTTFSIPISNNHEFVHERVKHFIQVFYRRPYNLFDTLWQIRATLHAEALRFTTISTRRIWPGLNW